MATVTASMESQTLIQSESHVQRITETTTSSGHEHRSLKKKKSSRRHKDEGSISVSKSSEKLHRKMKASEPEANPQCEKCARPVYAMERIKAEKRVWHKECFRCVQCNKQLTVETYQSDHTTLYCKQHFKQLFEPKPVDEEDQPDSAPPKKHQLIICESKPVELPPDVVRASDKPDLGLEELSQLDVKSRFEVFEKRQKDEQPLPEPKAPREKSTALLSRLAKFKAKGMDVGVSDEYLNGIPVEASSSEPEDDDGDSDSVLRQSYRHSAKGEQPPPFTNMSELRGRFESPHCDQLERHRSRKQEIQNIRTRLFMGKQAKIKEMYEQSVLQSEQGVTSADRLSLELDAAKARAIKARFETGEVYNDENQPPRNRDIDDQALFDEGIGKKSRSIFLELDANSKSSALPSPPAHDPPRRKEIPFVPQDVVRSEDKVEEVRVATADISDRFKFFETYRPADHRKTFRITPTREPQPVSPSPSPPRCASPSQEEGVREAARQSHTASRMINVFRQMEENQHRQENHGPKPLKCFTPPPAGACPPADVSSGSGEEYTSEEDEGEEEDYPPHTAQDPALKQAQELARTKSFRSKFENWAQPERSPSAVVIERDDDGESQLDTAKSLRAKFENMNQSQTSVKCAATKVNRFV